MTDMKRVTVALPDEIDRKVLEIRKKKEYERFSYSKIVRMLLVAGIETKMGKDIT